MTVKLIQNKKIIYGSCTAHMHPVIKFFIDIPEEFASNYFNLQIGGCIIAETTMFTKVQFDKDTCILPEIYLDKQILYQIDFFENDAVIRADLCEYHCIQIFVGISRFNCREEPYYYQIAKDSEVGKCSTARYDISKRQYVSFKETDKLLDNNSDLTLQCPTKCKKNEIFENCEIKSPYNSKKYTNMNLCETLIVYKDRNYNNIINKDVLCRHGYCNCDNVLRYMGGMAALAFYD